MKLTHPDAWNMYAGGTFAADDKHSYDCQTTIGKYSISPFSHHSNVQWHLGYRVHFLNVLGKLSGGLWQALSESANLREARRLCQNHLEENGGKIE